MASPEAHIEAQYDRYDDNGVYDAATIRQMTGYEGDGANEDFTPEAIRARNPELAFQVAPTPVAEPTEPEAVPAPHPTDAQHYAYDREGWQAAMKDPAKRQAMEAGITALRAARRPMGAGRGNGS